MQWRNGYNKKLASIRKKFNKEKQRKKHWTKITFFFNPRWMLLGSGYILRLNFSFMTKLIKRLLSPSLKSTSSLPAGNDKSNFH